MMIARRCDDHHDDKNNKNVAGPCLQQTPPCPGWCPTWKHLFANIFLADMRGAGKIAQDFAASEGAQREAKRLSAV
jgi:hypothetical protein